MQLALFFPDPVFHSSHVPLEEHPTSPPSLRTAMGSPEYTRSSHWACSVPALWLGAIFSSLHFSMGTVCQSRASGWTQYVTHACHLIVTALETREIQPHFRDEEKEEQAEVPLAQSARDVTNSSQCGLMQAFIPGGLCRPSIQGPACPDGSPWPCLVWARGSCWSADRSSHTLTLSHACSVGTQPQQHFDGKIYEESNYCCWEGIKTIFHSPHPRATSVGATLGAPHVPSLFMARHHGHRLQLQFSANRFWSRDSRKHQAPALPPFPGLPSAPPTTKCLLRCSGQGFLLVCCFPGTGLSTQPGGSPHTHLYLSGRLLFNLQHPNPMPPSLGSLL